MSMFRMSTLMAASLRTGSAPGMSRTMVGARPTNSARFMRWWRVSVSLRSLTRACAVALRAVKAAKKSEDPEQLAGARAAVDQAKVALGERGPVWWDDGSPDFNQRQVRHTPYADWYHSLGL